MRIRKEARAARRQKIERTTELLTQIAAGVPHAVLHERVTENDKRRGIVPNVTDSHKNSAPQITVSEGPKELVDYSQEEERILLLDKAIDEISNSPYVKIKWWEEWRDEYSMVWVKMINEEQFTVILTSDQHYYDKYINRMEENYNFPAGTGFDSLMTDKREIVINVSNGDPLTTFNDIVEMYSLVTEDDLNKYLYLSAKTASMSNRQA